jgi:organic radical activating enzyme
MGNISEGLPVVWVNQAFTSMREDFLNNTLPSGCSICAVPAGTPSYRDWKNKKFTLSRMITNEDANTVTNPKSVTVVLSNISNVAHRTDEPGGSSLLEQKISNSSNLRKYVEDSSNALPITTLEGSFTNASIVIIRGGEPLMHPHIIELVDMILEESGDKLRQIIFKTNMTYRNIALFDKLLNLKNKVSVVFDVYIEGNTSVHEYIRHGAVWNNIVDNMLFVAKNYENINFHSTTQISILNIGYITDTLTAIHNLQKDSDLNIKFREINYHVDLDPRQHLNPRNLPYNIKQQYLNKIVGFDYSRIMIPNVHEMLNTCKNVLKSVPNYSMTPFYEYIEAFDEAAGTDYKTVYPELV